MKKQNVNQMAALFRMLSNSNRLCILCLCHENAVTVSELVNKLQLSQSLISHHLKHLRDARLVEGIRQGKNILYQVQDERVQCILEDMSTYASDTNNKGK